MHVIAVESGGAPVETPALPTSRLPAPEFGPHRLYANLQRAVGQGDDERLLGELNPATEQEAIASRVDGA